MHDAHEAYTQDLSSPAKEAVGGAWREFENRVQFAVLRHHGLITAYTAAHERIRWADRTALATERAALLPPDGPEWDVMRTHTPVSWYDFDRFRAHDWGSWRDAFELRYQALMLARDIRAVEIATPASVAHGAAAIALCQRIVHPEDLGHAVTFEVRQLARQALEPQSQRTRVDEA